MGAIDDANIVRDIDLHRELLQNVPIEPHGCVK